MTLAIVKPSPIAEQLAWEIAKCPEVSIALSGSGPCSKVVNWQVDQFSGDKSKLHRPEAWAGNLESAKVMFVGSNPSFDINEHFPDWSGSWTKAEIIDFMTSRFSISTTRAYGVGDGSGRIRDRNICKDEKFSKDPTRTWRIARKNAALMLSQDIEGTLASRDYVLTEVVHCKSTHEIGVTDECIGKCSSTWIDRIGTLCPAKLVFVCGKYAGEFLKKTDVDLLETWGPPNYWPKSLKDMNENWGISEQESHTNELEIWGKTRLVVWIPHFVRAQPQTFSDPRLIDPILLRRWQAAAQGSFSS